MKRLAVKRLATELLAITATGVLAPGGEAHAQDAQVLHFGDDTIDAAGPVSPLVEKALQAYVYGYTPVYFDVSMQTYTNVVKPSENPNQMWAPVDQFFHVRRQQTVENTMGVAPNSDTLYTMAYLDVSKEPIIWHRPAWAGHYYVCQSTTSGPTTFRSAIAPTPDRSKSTMR